MWKEKRRKAARGEHSVEKVAGVMNQQVASLLKDNV